MSTNSLTKDYSSNQKSIIGQATLHEKILAGTSRVFSFREYPKGLRVNKSGVLAFKDAAGTLSDYDVLQGEIFPFENILEIDVSTTADIHVWW